MFKIDNSTANLVEPLRSAAGPNVNGSFDDTLETIVSDEWLNMVQNELANIVVQSGATPDKADDTQLFVAMLAIISRISLSNCSLRTGPQDIQLNAVVFANNQFVAVGNTDGVDALIATSPDGINWTQQANPENAHLNAILWDGAQYVACGSYNIGTGTVYIATSPDGINWTQRACPTASIVLNGIAYDGVSTYVIAGNGGAGVGTVLTSIDNGVTWISRANPADAALFKVTYAGGLFVATGTLGATEANILTSPDGITWSKRSNPKNFQLYGITYGNGLFVAVGAADGGDAYIVTSPDAINWTERANPKNLSLERVQWLNNMFVAPGYSDTDDSYLCVSLDGVTWFEITMPGNYVMFDAAYGAGNFVIVGQATGTGCAIYKSMKVF